MEEQTKQTFEQYIKELNKVISTMEELANEKWEEDSSKNFCEKYNIFYDESQFRQYCITKEKVVDADFTEITTELSREKEKISELISDSGIWESFNSQYKNYVVNRTNFIHIFVNDFNEAFNYNQRSFVDYLKELNNKLLQLQQNINSNLDELFENFKYGNKNYVIFGKNGAGKTTLLKKISMDILNKDSFVIPADRNVTYTINQIISLNLQYSFNQMLQDPRHAIYYLYAKLCSKSIDQYDAKVQEDDVLFKKFTSIFKSLGIDRQVLKKEEEIHLYVSDENKSYSLSLGSDGERTVVYMIMAILLVPSNSFVFIDEPENHLNGALMRKLFDELELARPDVKFIYLTHNINFIETRKNVELIYLEKTDEYQKWAFKKISDFRDLDLDIVLNMEGTNDDILLCEGTNRNSIDYKVFKALYHDMEVMPVESCEKVIENTKGLNGKQFIFKRNVYGVIDNDYREQVEIETLKQDRINVLPYNELENLLLDGDILSSINEKLFDKDLNAIKQEIIRIIAKAKDQIMRAYINKRYQRILFANKFKCIDTISNEIDQINDKNKQLILDEIKAFENKFDEFVSKNNYDELLKIVSGKMFFGDVTKKMGCACKSDFEDKFVYLIDTKPEFKQMIKDKLGFNFN